MATVTFSAAAPENTDSVHFYFPEGQFDLTKGGSYETDDAGLLASISVHQWLQVNYEAAAADAVPVPDPNDPHQTPAADHLSIQASPEAVQAAAANQAAVAATNAAVPATQVENPTEGAAVIPPAPVVGDHTDDQGTSNATLTTDAAGNVIGVTN